MTASRAIRILIVHAAANVRGVGQGLRPNITEEQRTEVRCAIERVFAQANGREMDDSDRFNLGLE